MSNQSGTQAVDRAARLLSEVVHSADPMTFTGLSAATGLAKSTTSRLLLALERNGLVRRDDHGRFLPGEMFVSFAWRGGAEAGLVAVAQPFLERLGKATGETINLGVASNGLVEQIAQVDSTFLIGGTNWIGMSVPLHCSALGKVLLAYGAAHGQDGHQRGGAAHRAGHRADPRLRRDRRGARTRPDRGGHAGPRLRRRRGRGAVGIGPDDQDEPGRADRHGRVLRRGGRRPVRGPRLPAARRPAASQGRLTTTGRRYAMTTEELLGQLYDETLTGNKPAVLELTNAGLAQGLGPETLLYEALIPSLEEVGARFERGDFFVPEMLIAGKAMAGALEILRPLLAETGAQTIGKIVMGTVKGDVHDIGKNLVNIMFEGAGFEVIDLGVQVAPEKFVDAIKEHQPDIVGFSAFLTTTMPMFKANINALQKSGLRDQVIVMVGGAPVTQEYADVVGADGYAADASAAVVRAKELIAQRRAPARV
jgi:5-methyltetrahydrofolate--homocysteine methyltransferase